MPEVTRTCPDCDSTMHPIKLLDATNLGMGTEGIGHVEQAYAAINAEASWVTKTVPKAGTVRANICPQCGRIVLHGSSPSMGKKDRKPSCDDTIHSSYGFDECGHDSYPSVGAETSCPLSFLFDSAFLS